MYMAWRYESPTTALAWALIVIRAAAAPLLAVYLSMARLLPVTARDILAQAELASGAGVIRDVVREAQDASAPLADKIALYGASAVMAAPDRARLEGMLAVVQRRQDGTSGTRGDGAAPPPPTSPMPDPDPDPPHPRPPTGPGSPRVKGGRERGHANGTDTRHTATAGTLLTLPRVRTHPDEPPTSAPASRPTAARARTGRVKKRRVRTPSAV